MGKDNAARFFSRSFFPLWLSSKRSIHLMNNRHHSVLKIHILKYQITESHSEWLDADTKRTRSWVGLRDLDPCLPVLLILGPILIKQNGRLNASQYLRCPLSQPVYCWFHIYWIRVFWSFTEMKCALNEWKNVSEKSRAGIILGSYEIMSKWIYCRDVGT